MPAKSLFATSVVVALFLGLSQGLQLKSKSSSTISSRLQANLGRHKDKIIAQTQVTENAYELEGSDYDTLYQLGELAYRVRYGGDSHVSTYSSPYQYYGYYSRLAKGAFTQRSSFQNWIQDETDRLKSLEQEMYTELLAEKDEQQLQIREEFLNNFPSYDENAEEWHLSRNDAENIYSFVDTLASYDHSLNATETISEILGQVSNATSQDEYNQVYNEIASSLWRRTDDNLNYDQALLRDRYESNHTSNGTNTTSYEDCANGQYYYLSYYDWDQFYSLTNDTWKVLQYFSPGQYSDEYQFISEGQSEVQKLCSYEQFQELINEGNQSLQYVRLYYPFLFEAWKPSQEDNKKVEDLIKSYLNELLRVKGKEIKENAYSSVNYTTSEESFNQALSYLQTSIESSIAYLKGEYNYNNLAENKKTKSNSQIKERHLGRVINLIKSPYHLLK
ncbi:UNKNOWN [Stylonychia lemnae]|uniref:Uncharacterized protein n=1 Tax=Stylonychia lemnae TaxID=5949 RepID=A0A077ZU85_STYLE|nr:UNKNOWN [Stylonychia lemnae]|eukprot:CDW73139.1 UNKNOWN [Stylonychia lemnae]